MSSLSASLLCAAPGRTARRSGSRVAARRCVVYAATGGTVTLQHEGKTHTLAVASGDSILESALSKGVKVPYDCKMGVCMTCPAKLVSGTVDQSGGSMLSDDVKEMGFVLLCCSLPMGDCEVRTVDEEELLAFQMHSGAL